MVIQRAPPEVDVSTVPQQTQTVGESMHTTEFPTGAPDGRVPRDALDGAVRLARLRARMFARIEPPKIGAFNVLRQIGSGGMGVVYAAWDPDLDRLVAIKVLRDSRSTDAAERLQREAVALARLRHPNVVSIYAVGLHRGQIYLAMEYVEGQTLGEWIDDWRSAPRPDHGALADVFGQAAQGLAAAHDAGLVHRDFKPDNVMIGADGRARLMDFGLARASASEEEMSTWVDRGSESAGTPSSTLFGTPGYMAPEQFVGESIGPAADQYAFMLALLKALTGVLFGADSSRAALAFRRLSESPDVHSESAVPRRARQLLARGLSVDPSARWDSMHIVAAGIRQAFVPRRPRTWHVITAMLGVGALGAAVLVSGDPVCEDADARLSGAWDTERRAQAVQRVGSSPAATRVVEQLDAYAQRWRVGHRDACAATRIAASQSESVLDLRMRCLSRARTELDAATEALAAADVSGMSALLAAVRLHDGLPELDHCADLDRLHAARLDPSDPKQRVEADAIRAELARTRVRGNAGHDVAVQLTALRERADALGFVPVQAELALEEALAAENRELTPRAKYEHALEALDLAEASGHDTLALAAWEVMTMWAGAQHADPQILDLYARRATAAWTRARAGSVSKANLERHIGAAWRSSGDLDRARPHLLAAVELFERHPGQNETRYAFALVSLGLLHADANELPSARESLERALAVLERVYGPDHPELLTALLGLSDVLTNSNTVESERLLRRAGAIVTTAKLRDTEMGLQVTRQLLVLLHAAGRPDEAVEVGRDALRASIERSTSELHTADLQMMLGRTLYTARRCAEAIPVLTASVDASVRLKDSRIELGARLGRAACLVADDPARAIDDPARAIPDVDRILSELEGRGESKTTFYARALRVSAAARRIVDPQTALEHVAFARELVGHDEGGVAALDSVEALIREANAPVEGTRSGNER